MKKITMCQKLQTIFFLCLVFIVSSSKGQNAEVKPAMFNDGETIVFFGNSITHGGTYHAFINLFYLTRFPERKIRIVNSGISGNELPNGIERLEKDVLVHKPDVIVMMYGMNDARVDGILPEDTEQEKQAKLQARINDYRQNLDSVSQIIRSRGIRIIYIAPTIYDDKVEVESSPRYGGNKAIGMCRDVVYQMAEKYHSPVVDFYTLMNEVNERYQKDDPTFTVVGADRVHPGKEGHLLMAYQFLKAQEVPPLISEIVVDASNISVEKETNCEVAGIKRDGDEILFAAKSNALPFPVIDNEACNWVPVIKDLNQELLKITGLKSGTYSLRIDDIPVGSFTNQQLLSGINLGTIDNTPQYKQAMLVKELNQNRTDLVKNRIRSLAMFNFDWFRSVSEETPLDSLQVLCDKELKQIEGKGYYSYIKNQVNNYLLYKPQVDETNKRIGQIEKSLQLINQPEWHKYSLVLNK